MAHSLGESAERHVRSGELSVGPADRLVQVGVWRSHLVLQGAYCALLKIPPAFTTVFLLCNPLSSRVPNEAVSTHLVSRIQGS